MVSSGTSGFGTLSNLKTWPSLRAALLWQTPLAATVGAPAALRMEMPFGVPGGRTQATPIYDLLPYMDISSISRMGPGGEDAGDPNRSGETMIYYHIWT